MLTPQEKKSLARIEKNLGMPRWKFILIYGLIFGVTLVAVTSAIDIVAKRLTVGELVSRRLWINLAIIPISGFLFAKIFH
jgi:hypothetical protein